MKLLAIDTSTDIASVALKIDQDISTEIWSDQRKQAQNILPAIQKLLSEADIQLQALDGIVFGRGPGSFTGLRIACSIAKGLAYTSTLPLYPVSTLLAIAAEVRHESRYQALPVLSVIDARMQEWYWSYYASGRWTTSEKVTAATDIHIDSLSEFVLAGSGFEADFSVLPDAVKKYCIHTMPTYPKASIMIQLVENGLIERMDPAQAEPVYIRNSVIQGAASRIGEK